MDFNYLIITFFIFLNFFFIFFFQNIKIFHTNIDQPDLKRKLHKKPIPLAGGIIIFVNILYMDEYTIEYANSWIKNTCEYKKSLVQKYISIDHNKKYSKYDLNKLMINMDLSDIFYIGW